MKKQFSGSFSYKKDIGKVRDSNEDETITEYFERVQKLVEKKGSSK